MSATSRRTWRHGFVAVIAALMVCTLQPAVATAAPSAPDGLAPNGTSASGSPVLEWKRVSGASSYNVEVAKTPSFDSVIWKVTTTNRRATPTVQLPSGETWWRVRGVSDSTVGAWSTASFDRGLLTGPTLIAPESDQSLGQPETPALLAWTPVNGSTGYTVEISTDPNFIDPSLVKTYSTKTASLVVPQTQIATIYYWRVRATLAAGIFTEWSETRNYTIGGLSKPELAGPTSSPFTTVDDVVLAWHPVPGAKTYDLQVSTDANFLTTDLTTSGIKGTRYSPPTTLGNDQYYWRVRPIDVQGNSLDWGAVETWTFRRAWSEQPTLEHPADGDTVGDPFYYQWSPIRLASSYTLQLSKTADFNSSDIVDTCTTVHTTFIPATKSDCWPAAAGSYYWRVYATDAPASPPITTDKIVAEKRRFTYLPDLVNLSSPADGASVQIPTLRWQPVAGASEYRVTISPVDGGGGGGTFTTAALSFTPRTKLTPGKSYRWQVQSVSESGRVGTDLMIGGQPTFTVEALPAATGATPEPTAPANGSLSTRFPTLSWEPVAAATSYRVYVRRAGTIGFTQVSGTFQYPSGEDLGAGWLAADSYDWKVEAYGSNGFISSSSAIGSFTIQSLVSSSGHRTAITGSALASSASSCSVALPNQCEDLRQTPALAWSPQPLAGYYRVWLSRDKEMTNVLGGFPVTVESNQWMPTSALIDSQAGSAFFWFVQPCKSSGACAPLEHARNAFSKKSNPVELVAPLSGSEQANDVTFTWRDYLATNSDTTSGKVDATGVHSTIEARQYRLQVSTDPNFQSTLETAVVDQTTFTSYVNTYPEGPVYWRVQAIDGSGNSLTWSATGTFLKRSPAPVLSSPVGGEEIAGTQPLVWQPLAFAASYDVEVYKNDDKLGSSTNRVVSGNSKQVAFSPSAPLPASSTPYRWRVRRVDASGRKGAWSDLGASGAAFRVVGTAPALLMPSGGEFVAASDALFAWDTVSGATSYKYERRAVGAASNTESITTVALAWAPTRPIADGQWQWRLSSLDASGVPIASTPWRDFAVDSTRPTATLRSPLNRARVSANFTIDFSERVKNANSSTIKLFQKGVRLPLSAKVTLNATGKTATLNPARNLKSGKVYTLKLSRGITDVAGNSLVAGTWRVTAK